MCVCVVVLAADIDALETCAGQCSYTVRLPISPQLGQTCPACSLEIVSERGDSLQKTHHLVPISPNLVNKTSELCGRNKNGHMWHSPPPFNSNRVDPQSLLAAYWRHNPVVCFLGEKRSPNPFSL